MPRHAIAPYRADAEAIAHLHGRGDRSETSKSVRPSVDVLGASRMQGRDFIANSHANRARSRSPLRRRQACTRHADLSDVDFVANSPPTNRQKREELVMKVQLLQLLESALESGSAVMVDSDEPDWKPCENKHTTTKSETRGIATKSTNIATRWGAFGKLVTMVCASLRRDKRPSTSSSANR
jgi:hypothetical protein